MDRFVFTLTIFYTKGGFYLAEKIYINYSNFIIIISRLITL